MVMVLDRLLKLNRAVKPGLCAVEDRARPRIGPENGSAMRGDNLSHQPPVRTAQVVVMFWRDIRGADDVAEERGHRARADRQRIVALTLRLDALLTEQPFVK